MFVTDKEQIVKAILPHVPETEIADMDYAMKTWWQNIRRSGGLGLTALGDVIFRLSGLEYWDFEIAPGNELGNIGIAMLLDKHMKSPYFVVMTKKKKYVRVYDSRAATLITLQGNIVEYLKMFKEEK